MGSTEVPNNSSNGRSLNFLELWRAKTMAESGELREVGSCLELDAYEACTCLDKIYREGEKREATHAAWDHLYPIVKKKTELRYYVQGAK
tara:strand:+ start:13959 stop:14228 length:270 start_codon:yes stop_codon:yes gene_type:complete